MAPTGPHINHLQGFSLHSRTPAAGPTSVCSGLDARRPRNRKVRDKPPTGTIHWITMGHRIAGVQRRELPQESPICCVQGTNGKVKYIRFSWDHRRPRGNTLPPRLIGTPITLICVLGAEMGHRERDRKTLKDRDIYNFEHNYDMGTWRSFSGSPCSPLIGDHRRQHWLAEGLPHYQKRKLYFWERTAVSRNTNPGLATFYSPVEENSSPNWQISLWTRTDQDTLSNFRPGAPEFHLAIATA